MKQIQREEIVGLVVVRHNPVVHVVDIHSSITTFLLSDFWGFDGSVNILSFRQSPKSERRHDSLVDAVPSKNLWGEKKRVGFVRVGSISSPEKK